MDHGNPRDRGRARAGSARTSTSPSASCASPSASAIRVWPAHVDPTVAYHERAHLVVGRRGAGELADRSARLVSKRADGASRLDGFTMPPIRRYGLAMSAEAAGPPAGASRRPPEDDLDGAARRGAARAGPGRRGARPRPGAVRARLPDPAQIQKLLEAQKRWSPRSARSGGRPTPRRRREAGGRRRARAPRRSRARAPASASPQPAAAASPARAPRGEAARRRRRRSDGDPARRAVRARRKRRARARRRAAAPAHRRLVPGARRRGARRGRRAGHAARACSTRSRAPSSRRAARSTCATRSRGSAASAPTSTASSAVSTACSASSRRSRRRSTSSGCRARLAKLTTYHQGMVLVTGPTGSGKTSTLAALVDLINEERREHILTDRGSDRVRAPVEALPDQPAQREAPHASPSRARCARRCARTPT